VSPHADIAEFGRGRFSHWGEAIIFSASDNTDANTNGRRYWAVSPDN
jgi:pectate lyase